MKKLTTKIVAVAAAVILLTAVMAPTAFAAIGGFDLGGFSELLGGDFDLSGIAEILGELFNQGGNSNGISLSDIFSNPNGVLDILQERLANMNVEATPTQIADAITKMLGDANPGDITSLLSSNDFLNQLAEYLRATQTTEPLTEVTTTEPSTEASTTEAGATESTSYEIPTIIIPSTYVYQGADAYSTQASTTTTEPVYSYVQPSTQYTEPITSVPFTPVVEDSARNTASNNSAKLIIGAMVVLAGVAGVVVVASMLKKTKA